MKANTRLFGEIDIDEEKIITLENGMIGFPDLRKFTLIFDKEKERTPSSIMWFQSMDEPEIAFPVMHPNEIKPDYAPSVSDEMLTPLGDLTEDGFEQYKDAIKDPLRQKRAKHAVYENQRTIRAVEALRNNDVKLFGQLMNASHESLRHDYEVSCEEIDILVDLAQAMPGVIGSRITGGGFGGCTVSIVEDATVDRFIEEIGKTYKEKVGHEAEFYVVEIGDGAKIV